MSWDVLIAAAEVPPPPMAETPDDWRLAPMGTRDEIRSQITATLPTVNWSDPHWGTFEGDGFTFEFSVSARKPEPLDSIMVHVRGGGGAVPLLLKLAADHGWYLFDCSESEWIHHLDQVDAGWTGWQDFRNRNLGGPASAG